MAVSYQLVIDCTSPELLAHFWAEASHYVIAPPPSGSDSWDDFYRSIGVPEDELGTDPDRIEDPNGEGPRIWFQIVPEKKSIKNRIHIDVNASGGRDVSLDTRRERVEAEAARLVSLGATRLHERRGGPGPYAVALPEVDRRWARDHLDDIRVINTDHFIIFRHPEGCRSASP